MPLLKLEASFAMMRVVGDAPFIAAAGWLAGGGHPSEAGLWLTATALVLSRGAGNVINDIIDFEEDRVTNPWLPLPSGLLNLRQAMFTVVLLVVTVTVLLAASSGSLLEFVLAGALMLLGGGLVVLYSIAPAGPIATLIAASPFTVLALVPWVLAGADGSSIVFLFAGTLLYGLGMHVVTQLYDIDSDAEAGNRTIAVRGGPTRILTLGAAADLGTHLTTLGAAAKQGRLALICVLAAISAAILLFAYRVADRRQRTVRGRFARASSLKWLYRARLGGLIVFVAVFSPLTATGLCLAAAVAIPLLHAHERHVVSGGLARRLRAQESGEPA